MRTSNPTCHTGLSCNHLQWTRPRLNKSYITDQEVDLWNHMQYPILVSRPGNERLRQFCETVTLAIFTNVNCTFGNAQWRAKRHKDLPLIEYQYHQVNQCMHFWGFFLSSTDLLERNYVTILWIVALDGTVLSGITLYKGVECEFVFNRISNLILNTTYYYSASCTDSYLKDN
jgi:hypothetical protein